MRVALHPGPRHPQRKHAELFGKPLAVLALAGSLTSTPLVAERAFFTCNPEGTEALCSAELNGGEVEVVGPTGGGEVRSLAFDPSGRLFGLSAAPGERRLDLVRVDSESGSAAVVGPLGIEVKRFTESLTFDAAGGLWLGAFDASGQPDVFAVDVESGAATPSHLSGVLPTTWFGLISAREGLIAVSAAGAVYRAELEAGEFQLLAPELPFEPGTLQGVLVGDLDFDREGQLWGKNRIFAPISGQCNNDVALRTVELARFYQPERASFAIGCLTTGGLAIAPPQELSVGVLGVAAPASIPTLDGAGWILFVALLLLAALRTFRA